MMSCPWILLLAVVIAPTDLPGDAAQLSEWVIQTREAIEVSGAEDQRRSLEESRSLLQLHADHQELRTVHAELLLRVGRPAAAQDAIDVLWESGVDPSAAAYRVAGMLALARGESHRAQRLARDGLATHPDDLPLLFWSAGAAADRPQALERLRRYLCMAKEANADADRVTAVHGTIAVYEALGETVVWKTVSAPERATLPLRALYAADGRLQGYLLRIRPARGRRALRLLLDTGSTGLFLTPSAARRLAFKSLARTTTFGGGGDGRHRSRRGLVPRLALGELVYENALATVAPGALDPEGRYDGVIGLQPFAAYRVILDGLQRELRLLPTAVESRGEPYWRFSGQMLVTAGTPGGVVGMFVFDSGAYETLLSRTFADRLPDVRVREGGNVRGFGGRMRGLYGVEGARVEFLGRLTAKRRLVALDLSLASRLGGIELAGYLGIDLLGETMIEIDGPAQRLRFLEP